VFTADNIALFIIAVAVALAVAVLYDRLHARTIDYRETHLETEVKDLRTTVDDQEKRLSNQQNEIAVLHRLLGEAQLQINYLQTEVTFYKRRADELEARLLAAGNQKKQPE
jgi:septal ring factor EnvC (AmiA/AmiB activator)